MSRRYYFVTHPQVVIDPRIPVTRWPLSEIGRRRMERGLKQPWIANVSAIYCSTEQKAMDGAQILAEHLALPYTPVAALGENDRSATGYLLPDEFEAMADAFFASPSRSIRGWESAERAQRRIVEAVQAMDAREVSAGGIVVVSHGAVGALLSCFLAGQPISRRWDQPRNGGGNYFSFTLHPPQADSGWLPFDLPGV